MKEVVSLIQTLHISNRIPLGTEMSLGEFIGLMENQVKGEFFTKILSSIKFNKQYTFKVEVVDISTEEWYNITVETFKFTMYELDDDDIITKQERVYMKDVFHF